VTVHRFVLAVAWTVACATNVLAQELPSNACDRLKSLAMPNAKVTAAAVVPAGPFRCDWCTADQTVDVPASCRVTASMKSTTDSDIEMELWIPLADWNGKLLGVGNANFCGGEDTPRMALGLRQHYAAVGTDLGHKGCDASFAVGHPEKVIDFGYRALHETTLRAKDALAALYGSAPKHSYFSGCSTGGNQALMEAQRYPDDYDGVVAGAPTNYLHFHGSGIWNSQVGSVLPRDKRELLHRAVLAACDSRDAVGLLDDPRQCRFDPETLLCPGAEDAPNCLTRAQAEAAKKIYAGPTSTRTGEVIYPGLERGSELGWPPGRQPGLNQLSYYRDAVHEDANWDWHTFDVERDVALADQKHGRILSAVDPDLRLFAERGGKLILYHGWDDALAPQNTVNYYESVVTTIGKQADTVVRLFMIPRVAHCGGGSGTDQFNALAALERWVEAGIAPDRITAQHVTGNRVDMERPLCPYPQVARWKGLGSTNDAANFECAAPTPDRPK
jgi:tannase/feruloyl esterase